MSFDIIMWSQNMEKNQIMLHGYRQLYSLHKNRRCSHRHCRMCETRFDTSNHELELLKTITYNHYLKKSRKK